jgi:hypothetical protein
MRNIIVDGAITKMHFQESLRPKPVMALFEMLAGINFLVPIIVFGVVAIWVYYLVTKSFDSKLNNNGARNLAAIFSIAGVSLLIGLFILGSFLDFDMIGIRLLTPALLPMLIGTALFVYPLWEKMMRNTVTKTIAYGGFGLMMLAFLFVDMKMGLPSIYGEREETVHFYKELKEKEYYKSAPFLITDFHTEAQMFSLKPLASVVGDKKRAAIFEGIMAANPDALLILRQIEENAGLIDSLGNAATIEMVPQIDNGRKIFRNKS